MSDQTKKEVKMDMYERKEIEEMIEDEILHNLHLTASPEGTIIKITLKYGPNLISEVEVSMPHVPAPTLGPLPKNEPNFSPYDLEAVHKFLNKDSTKNGVIC